MDEKIKAVYELLKANNIYANVYQYGQLPDQHGQLPVVCVEIEWGDWKHEHWRADWLIEEELKGNKIKVEITEDDGSDTYSAIHYYMF